jgi:hypothetical protein
VSSFYTWVARGQRNVIYSDDRGVPAKRAGFFFPSGKGKPRAELRRGRSCPGEAYQAMPAVSWSTCQLHILVSAQSID